MNRVDPLGQWEELVEFLLVLPLPVTLYDDLLDVIYDE